MMGFISSDAMEHKKKKNLNHTFVFKKKKNLNYGKCQDYDLRNTRVNKYFQKTIQGQPFMKTEEK